MGTGSEAVNVSGDRSAETRARILEAALREFAALGMAGARMDQIAGAAGVNKALLYYHFESKEKLYVAALEMISAKIRDRSMAVFLRDASAGERLLRTALDHFDRILAQGAFQSLLQQEMMRLHQGESDALPVLVKRVFAPLQSMYQSMMREGIASGELIDADWLQIHLAALGANIFYFLAAPVWRLVMPFDPYAADVLEARRHAVVEFLGKAVFTDRAHGTELAAKVLADTPMPELPSTRPFVGRNDERKK
ncbi:MAG TPA: TetR/AcrR family transcriptional regulator [Terracidiphilus sp.]|nr:TetR/AcrR family transcriptional regulator [Terracidiphilus sp.]